MSKIRLVIAGAAGRMGQTLIKEAVRSTAFQLVAGLEAPGNPDQGKDHE